MALVLEKSETNGLGTPKPSKWAGGARWCPQFSSPQTQQLADSWVSSLVLAVRNKKSLASPKSLDGLTTKNDQHWWLNLDGWSSIASFFCCHCHWLVLKSRNTEVTKERRKRRRTCLALRGECGQGSSVKAWHHGTYRWAGWCFSLDTGRCHVCKTVACRTKYDLRSVLQMDG